MAQAEGEWRPYNGPCPECGSTGDFTQEITQRERVRTNVNGVPEWFDPISDTHEVQRVWCRDCDELIWEQEKDNA